jgi:hypothetical protein
MPEQISATESGHPAHSAAHPETQKHLHQCPHCCWQHLQGVFNQWDTIWDQQSNTISNAAFAWSLLRGARKLQPKQLLAQHGNKPQTTLSSLSQEQGRCDLNYFLLVHVGSCWFGVPSMTKEKSKPQSQQHHSGSCNKGAKRSTSAALEPIKPMACAWSPETQGEGRHAGHRGAMNGPHPKASCFFTIVCPILYVFKWFFPYVSISPRAFTFQPPIWRCAALALAPCL